MAISKAAEDAKATATTGAPSTPSVTTPASASAVSTATGKDAKSKHDQFKARGEKIREGFTEEEKALEGSKSNTIAFIGCLGDPNKPQPRRENKQDLPSLVVVGYKFKALEDVLVPTANLKPNFKSLMDVEDADDVLVKAGEIFNLNLFETGSLISRPQYAGQFTGEGESVSLGLKFAGSREEPLPILKKDGAGSVKLNMFEVADMLPNPKDPEAKGTPKVKEEYASKFAVLYSKKSSGQKGASPAKATGEVSKDLAAAFQDFLARKK